MISAKAATCFKVSVELTVGEFYHSGGSGNTVAWAAIEPTKSRSQMRVSEGGLSVSEILVDYFSRGSPNFRVGNL